MSLNLDIPYKQEELVQVQIDIEEYVSSNKII